MARRKSINDLQNQARRIERELLNRGFGGASQRFGRVEDAYSRYARNIARQIGGELGRRGYTYDTDPNVRVSRSVYMGLNDG